jgi:hypothetical protein
MLEEPISFAMGRPYTAMDWVKRLKGVQVVLIHQGVNWDRRIADLYVHLHQPTKEKVIPLKQPQGTLAAIPGESFQKVLQINLGTEPFLCLQTVVWHPTVERVLRALQYAKKITHDYNGTSPFNADHKTLQILALVGAKGWEKDKGQPTPQQACQRMDQQMIHWKALSDANSAYWLGTGLRTDGPDYVSDINRKMRLLPTESPGVGRIPIDHHFTERQYCDPRRELGSNKEQWDRETDRELLNQLAAHIEEGGPRWGIPPRFQPHRPRRTVTRMLPSRRIDDHAGHSPAAREAVLVDDDARGLEEWAD